MEEKDHEKDGKTTISVKNSTWARLNSYKKVGESFDDVVNRIMDEIGDDKGDERN